MNFLWCALGFHQYVWATPCQKKYVYFTRDLSKKATVGKTFQEGKCLRCGYVSMREL